MDIKEPNVRYCKDKFKERRNRYNVALCGVKFKSRIKRDWKEKNKALLVNVT